METIESSYSAQYSGMIIISPRMVSSAKPTHLPQSAGSVTIAGYGDIMNATESRTSAKPIIAMPEFM
jgi:hypothetical protein